jgi:hypothetical protein
MPTLVAPFMLTCNQENSTRLVKKSIEPLVSSNLYRVLQQVYDSRIGSYRGKILCSLMTFDTVLLNVKV